MYFFTSDEHYGHANIIKYCNRPFSDVHEMNKELIKRHNEVVAEKDVVIHVGDTSLRSKEEDVFGKYIYKLNGSHIFLKGSHDRWLNKLYHEIWQKNIEGIYVVACHYAMLTWPRSHYGSWQLFGHSHGGLTTYKKNKQYDVGVDNNNFYPISFEQLKKILE